METAALPLCYYPNLSKALLCFLMGRALIATRAIFYLLKTLSHGLFIARGSIITLFALGARQYRQFAHIYFPLVLLRPARRSTDHSWPNCRAGFSQKTSCDYLITFETVPAPTVRPPSRIAKRIFSSRATGAISWTVNSTLSPGITISTPSGSWISPVTSVVRI